MKKINLLQKITLLIIAFFTFGFVNDIKVNNTKSYQLKSKITKNFIIVELAIKYEPGLTRFQKAAVRNCISSKYGITFNSLELTGPNDELWNVNSYNTLPGWTGDLVDEDPDNENIEGTPPGTSSGTTCSNLISAIVYPL